MMTAFSDVKEVKGGSPPSGWRRWVEPWFLSYALLGASVAGLAPILLPLAVAGSGNVGEIGLVVGAFNLGGLSAPLWGGIADRRGLHRLLLFLGLLVTALGLAAFPFVSSLRARILLSLIQGSGAACVGTLASLFIVESHPHPEWDERIGWLQTFYGAGQVLGLVLAGILSGVTMTTGFVVASTATLLAVLPAMSMKSNPRSVPFVRPVLKNPSRHAGLSLGSPQSFYHHLNAKAFKHAARNLVSPLGLFLVAWLISFAGVAAFFSLFPVLMKNIYGVGPSISSFGFAVAATAGLFVYAPAGHWSRRYGPVPVLNAALGIRLLAFVALIILSIVGESVRGSLALVSFLFVVVAWSLLSVAGTDIAAQLSENHEGEGLGLFNASTAVGGVVGAVAGGWSAERWGYEIVPLLGVIGVMVGILMMVVVGKLKRKQDEKER